MGFIFFLLVLGVVVLLFASMWKLYEMAGKPGWAAIVPIYNILVQLEIIKKPWWWLLLIIIPYVGVIWAIWSTNLLMKSFGKTEGYTIGVILLPFIFLPMLAFNKDTRFVGLDGAGSAPVDSNDELLDDPI